MSLWYPYASISVGAIGRGYATTLDELVAYRRGRGDGIWGNFVVKTEQKQCLWHTVRRRVGRQPRANVIIFPTSEPLEAPLPIPRPPVAIGWAPPSPWQNACVARVRLGSPFQIRKAPYIRVRPCYVRVTLCYVRDSQP